MVSIEPTTEDHVSICSRTIQGHLEVLTDPGKLRARVTVKGEAPVEIHLPGSALERAMLFDGKDARVSYQETSLNGKVLDCTISVVNRGTPMTGAEFVARLDELTDSMSQEQRETLADSLDPRWRQSR